MVWEWVPQVARVEAEAKVAKEAKVDPHKVDHHQEEPHKVDHHQEDPHKVDQHKVAKVLQVAKEALAACQVPPVREVNHQEVPHQNQVDHQEVPLHQEDLVVCQVPAE